MSNDSVAQDQLVAFVERILRLKGEARDLNRDIREIYAEAKGNGFDKTTLGKLVNYVERRNEDSSAVAEADALFDLYLNAFDAPRPSHAHTHAREGVLTKAEQTSARRAKAHTEPAEAVNPGVADDAHGAAEPVEVSSAPDTSSPVDDADGPSGGGVNVVTPAAGPGGGVDRQPLQSSTDAPTVAAEVTTPEANTHGQTGTADDAGSQAIVPANAEAVAKKVEQSEQEALVEPPVETNIEATDKPAGFFAESANNSAAPAPFKTLAQQAIDRALDVRAKAKNWRHEDPAHPGCLDPAQCGGFSNLGLCQRCKAAAGVQVEHA